MLPDARRPAPPAAQAWRGRLTEMAVASLFPKIGIAMVPRAPESLLPEGLVMFPDGRDGLAGVRFMNACADSAEAGSDWVALAA